MSRRFTVLSAMTLSLLITFAWTSLAVADDPKDEAIKKDRQRIEGTWRIVGLSINGNPAKEGDIAKLTVINRVDGTWTLRSEGEMVTKGTSTLDPTKKPKEIDFTATEGGGSGNHYLGIYQLGDSKRKMCFAPPGKPRPTEFESQPGSQIILVEFERKRTESKN